MPRRHASPRATLNLARLCLGAVLALAWLGWTGCSKPSAPTATDRPFAGTAQRLVVVDDEPLAAAIGRLAGEWQGHAGAELTVVSQSADEYAAGPAEGDAMIIPSAALAGLAQQGLIQPLPADAERLPELAFGDLFEAAKSAEVSWGGKHYAISFGSPVLTLFYRQDLLKRLDESPPRTWQEYQELAARLADRTALGDQAPPADAAWYGAIEPLGKPWAAVMLLARAAPYAKHPDYFSTLFDISTLEARIDGPPFVRALEELASLSRLGPAEQLGFSPADSLASMLRGECGLAIGWPGTGEPAAGATALDVGCAPLPGATQVYNDSLQRWEDRPEDAVVRVPLLAISGRMGVVAKSSQQPVAAAALLAWLASPKWSGQTSGHSSATTMFRPSQQDAAVLWARDQLDAPTAARFADAVATTLTEPNQLLALRLPGRERYLAALDEQVRRCLAGDVTAEQALAETAQAWEAITDELGRDAQRAAYRGSLGLTP